MCRESSQMEDSVKNHIDMLIFHTAICAGASQIATDGRRELDVLTLRNGDYHAKTGDHRTSGNDGRYG